MQLYSQTTGSFGKRILFRDHNGLFIKEKYVTQSGKLEPHEAEGWALMKTLQWITKLELNNVIIEIDCKVMANVMKTRLKGSSKFHYILAKCKNLLFLNQNSRVSFIRRQANQGAHALTRTSRFHASHHVYEHISNCIFFLL